MQVPKTIKAIIAIGGWAIFFEACKENVLQVTTHKASTNNPISVAYNVNYIYSELGKPIAHLRANCIKEFIFERTEDSFIRLESNVMIEFFDSLGNVESHLQADTAEFWEGQKLAKAWGKVIITNSKGEVLETQQLYWRKRDNIIHTNSQVKIYTEEEVLVGDSLIASPNLGQYKLYKIKGRLQLKEEK